MGDGDGGGSGSVGGDNIYKSNGERGVKNMNDGLQFLFPFSFYLLVFFISHLLSMFRTRVRV